MGEVPGPLLLMLHKRPGYLILEVLLGTTIFAMLLAGTAMTLIYGQENTINAGDRTRGAYLTERTMEGVRAIRDASFSSVSTGTKGIWVHKNTGLWGFSGSQVTLTGSYVVSVSISSKASGWMSFTGSTTWKHGYNRAGAVNLWGEITDWKSAQSIGNWASPSVDGTYAPGGTPSFNEVAVSGNTAYVTVGTSPGFYIIDITNTASPSRLNSGFSIGSAATGIAVKGKRLYVLTADTAAELKVYSITSASNPVLITSYNLPGSALGTGLGIGYNNLYVTSSYSATAGESEFYSFDISNSGSIVLKSSYNDTDSLNAVALSGTSAYIAASIDTAELRVMQTMSSGSLALVGGANLTDRTLDGTAIAVSGTSALLGTQRGTSIQEVVMFDIGGGDLPSSALGPWYHEGSGTIMDLAMDPYRCYGFIAASSNKKAFQVMNMRNKATLPELYSYNSTSGLARGLAYDLVRDRVYVMTDTAFLIFKPATSGATCP